MTAGLSYAPHAPVAQLDRVLPSEGRGRTFESCRARQRMKKAGLRRLFSVRRSDYIARDHLTILPRSSSFALVAGCSFPPLILVTSAASEPAFPLCLAEMSL